MATNKQAESNQGAKRGRGRPEGSVNKVTAEARGAFNDILKGRAKKVGGWIDKVAKNDPAKATDLLVEISNAPNPDGTDGEMVFRVRRD
jgi:hypothetical protein